MKQFVKELIFDLLQRGIQCGSGKRSIPETLLTFHKFSDGLMEGRIGATQNRCHRPQQCPRRRYRNYPAWKSWERGRKMRLGSFICLRWESSGGSATGRVAGVLITSAGAYGDVAIICTFTANNAVRNKVRPSIYASAPMEKRGWIATGHTMLIIAWNDSNWIEHVWGVLLWVANTNILKLNNLMKGGIGRSPVSFPAIPWWKLRRRRPSWPSSICFVLDSFLWVQWNSL